MKPCILWTGAQDGKGYGVKWVLGGGGRRTGAHRWAWEQVNGPVPDGLVIDHLCRTPLCVEPTHLEPVFQAENVRRGIGRYGINGTGRCSAGHDLTTPGALVGAAQPRCRTCWNSYMRDYNRNRKVSV